VTALTGQVAVVTGATQGIGAAIAAALAREGAVVVPVARSLGCDCRDEAQVTSLAARVRAEHGAPHILVNNAGAFLLKSLVETTAEEFRAQLEANTVGPFLMLKRFLPAMMAAGRGHVVTIGSIVDYQGFPGNAAYAASKWGVRGLHEVARAEAAGSGVRFTLISPGPTDTPLWDPFDPESRTDLPDRNAMLRPEEVAEAVRFVVTRGTVIEGLRVNPHV
jgi:NAD(P)-dependent dehydrogenase (short-subunit alcohol dehydrogenase family)